MSAVFHRTQMALELAAKLVKPDSAFADGYRSGLFIAGQRRIGKTTFLRHDLIPALEARGAIVIYVDLWTDLKANPATLVLNAVRETLRQLERSDSPLMTRLRVLRNVKLNLFGVGFDFAVDAVGEKGGVTLAAAMQEVVRRAEADVVLIVDEIQHVLTSDEGSQLLFSLKATRDAINQDPDTKGYFLFVGTGSHRAKVAELTARRQQAFDGAVSLPYPVLGPEFVTHLMTQMQPTAESNGRTMPSLEAAVEAFARLGHRPEELHKAFRLLMTEDPLPGAIDETLALIAATLRSAAADLEIQRLLTLGDLAVAIFDKITNAGIETKGLFSTAAAGEYTRMVGRPVKVDEIQRVALALNDENLIMRSGHGVYSVSDPFVQQVWLDNRSYHLPAAEEPSS